MGNLRVITAAACGVTLLLGLVPGGPGAVARVRGQADIGDLREDYWGQWASDNGDNESGTLGLEVDEVKGKNFTGGLEMIAVSGRSAGAEGFLFLAVDGSVSPKGKIKFGAKFDGSKLTCKGTLSDGGTLIQASYVVKEGRTVRDRGLMMFFQP